MTRSGSHAFYSKKDQIALVARIVIVEPNVKVSRFLRLSLADQKPKRCSDDFYGGNQTKR
jgi:hypothetical protein